MNAKFSKLSNILIFFYNDSCNKNKIWFKLLAQLQEHHYLNHVDQQQQQQKNIQKDVQIGVLQCFRYIQKPTQKKRQLKKDVLSSVSLYTMQYTLCIICVVYNGYYPCLNTILVNSVQTFKALINRKQQVFYRFRIQTAKEDLKLFSFYMHFQDRLFVVFNMSLHQTGVLLVFSK